MARLARGGLAMSGLLWRGRRALLWARWSCLRSRSAGLLCGREVGVEGREGFPSAGPGWWLSFHG